MSDPCDIVTLFLRCHLVYCMVLWKYQLKPLKIGLKNISTDPGLKLTHGSFFRPKTLLYTRAWNYPSRPLYFSCWQGKSDTLWILRWGYSLLMPHPHTTLHSTVLFTSAATHTQSPLFFCGEFISFRCLHPARSHSLLLWTGSPHLLNGGFPRFALPSCLVTSTTRELPNDKRQMTCPCGQNTQEEFHVRQWFLPPAPAGSVWPCHAAALRDCFKCTNWVMFTVARGAFWWTRWHEDITE